MPRPVIDLTGQRFGRLVVLQEHLPRTHREVRWTCACDCGAQVTPRGSQLRGETTTSCGCWLAERRATSLIGERFHYLVVASRALDYISPKGFTTPMWSCVCDCGGTAVRSLSNLKAGAGSCGRACSARMATYRAANPVPAPENRRRRVYHQRLGDGTIDRNAIWARDGGLCHLCGEAADPDAWAADHIIPIVHGGPHDPRNVAVSHPACNMAKGDRISFRSPLLASAIAAYEELHGS